MVDGRRSTIFSALSRKRASLTLGVITAGGFSVLGSIAAFLYLTSPNITLSVQPSQLDAGSVWPSFEYLHKFVVANESGHDVTVASIETSCSCTSLSPKAFVVPPGGSQEIVASLNLFKVLDASDARGRGIPFHVTLTPVLGSHSEAHASWHLVGQVCSVVRLSSNTLQFSSDLFAGSTFPEETIVLSSTLPLKDLRIAASGLGSVRARSLEPSSRKWEIGVSPSADSPLGCFNHRLYVTPVFESHEIQGVPSGPIVIPVAGVIQPPVHSVPSSLMLGAALLGERRGDTLTVCASSVAFKISRAAAPSDSGLSVIGISRPTDRTAILEISQLVVGTGQQTHLIDISVKEEGDGPEYVLRVPVIYHGLSAKKK